MCALVATTHLPFVASVLVCSIFACPSLPSFLPSFLPRSITLSLSLSISLSLSLSLTHTLTFFWLYFLLFLSSLSTPSSHQVMLSVVGKVS